MTEPSTADYRKYPKGPNFLLIVVLSGVVLVVLMLGVYFFLRSDGRQVLPLKHSQVSLRGDAAPVPAAPVAA